MAFYLSEINSEESLKELFIEKWNWNNPVISDLALDFSEEIGRKLEASSILCRRLDYKIYFFKLRNLEQPEKELKIFERKIITKTNLRENLENSIFVFSANNFDYLDFVRAEKVGNNIRIKKFHISPENRNKLRTPCEQLEKLRLISEKISPSYIKNQIEDAFSTESITERFYDEYIKVFREIKGVLIRQKVKVSEAEKEEKLRDFIHRLLNRIMFLYFVQKRGCFGGDKNFLANFWDAYKAEFKGKNEFHENWLNVLFFEALSQPSWRYQEKSYLGKFNEILKYAPYLNGGLFERDNKLDDVGWLIPDEFFDSIFEFFESYNFTIEESTPFDIDIAINPEMLGNIYEHLVNIEEEKEQARAGIFYTPKVEIELMIRRALVEFLFNKTKINKEKLYKFIFPEADIEIENPFTKNEANQLLEELNKIFILDPACGSGHYLVVALQILYQLKETLWKQLNRPHSTKYEEKKEIIERNIYGNDIKEWAVNVTKLRLWLDLFVDADEEMLRNSIEPLLPNLNFKIRRGDSLVQRIGSQLISLRKISSIIETRRNDLEFLIRKKEYVYKTGDNKEFKNTLNLEKKLLLNSLSDAEIKIKKEIQGTNSELDRVKRILDKNYLDMFEKESQGLPNKSEFLKRKEILMKKTESLKQELSSINKVKEELKNEEEIPMLWDLSFAEVFSIKNGFDIVIANPPYVRQERIDDLNKFYSKEEYKDKLIEQIKKDWEYKFWRKEPLTIDKKSDLYVYFYLKGLKLLNQNGILCYISSNSWLDVGYGAQMQEVLLRRVPLIAIYDNQAKRSFKHADVNTIIALMKAPKNNDFDEEIKQNEVRFINFKKPFDEIMYSEIFIDLEKNENLKEYPEGKRKENEIYKLHLVNQKALYEFGKNPKTGIYEGNKWGGKYLRAPEIYWKILEKGKGKLVRLGDITEVKFGIKTGANEFFYLKPIGKTVKEVVEIAEKNPKALIRVKNGAGWEGEIEVEFLKPVIKSPRELKTIIVRPEDLNYLVFMCHKDKKELSGTKALEYIEWGEKQRYQNRPTCKGRPRWWDLGKQEKRAYLWSRIHNESHRIYECDIYAADTFSVLYPHFNYEITGAIFNSSLTWLVKELYGRKVLGEGGLSSLGVDLIKIEIIHPQGIKDEINSHFSRLKKREIYPIFTELGFDPNKPIREQEPNPLPDRKALDDIVFDALGLTEEERKEVYWAVAELVKNRLEKARSI